MIDLEAIGTRWSAAFSGQADVRGISDTARASLNLFLAIEEKAAAPTVTMLTAEARLMLSEIVERRKLHDLALGDLHDLVKLALVVREYGKARIAHSEAFEAFDSAWNRDSDDPPTALARASNEARRAKDRALDRLEAIAVQLAGGDVAKVFEGEDSTNG